MPTARLALLAFACSSSLVHAGAVISLVPDPPQPAYDYLPGQNIQVNVFAQLDANSPATIRLRLAQFDVSDSDPALTITPIGNHPLQETQAFPGPIPFWNFGGSSACANDEASCGTNYFIDGSISNDDILNITYTGLTTSPTLMVILNQNAPTIVGSFEVAFPNIPGKYILDVLNADDADHNRGAEIVFGFSIFGFPTTWTAQDGTITGGRFTFYVGVPEPGTLALLFLGTVCLTTKNTKTTKE